MKTLNIPLDDKQFNKLYNCKYDYEVTHETRCSWQKFLMILLNYYEGEE